MRALVLVALVGCDYTPPRAGVDDAGPDAAKVCDVVWPYAPSNISPCDGMPDAVVTLGPGLYTLDTTTGEIVRGGFMTVATLPVTGTDPIVIPMLGLTMEVGAVVTLVGPGPVVLAVHGNASIAGEIIASALGSAPGPGAATDCAAMAGANADGLLAKAAGGGGAGGGFGGPGASGGNGDTVNGAAQTAGGIMSSPVGELILVPLRGGCSGGAGGEEHPMAPPATPGAGGAGGGAIQISVRDSLDLGATARIHANGGGGAGAVNMGSGGIKHVGAGGGGGGSGGAILVEATTVRIATAARLCANGGGGGAGSHETTSGSSGFDGLCAVTFAAGGTGEGDGGDGAFATTEATVGIAGGGEDGGGGGGGGGVGRIRVLAADGDTPSGFVSTPQSN